MATRKSTKATPKKEMAPHFNEADILDVDLLKFGREKMIHYSNETNLERAVPDLQDGLKPVQRRLMWAASKYAQGRMIKSARVVGDCMGKYHPHGDSSQYGALVGMTNSADFNNQVIAPFRGVGNFGALLDEAAAMRYTECGLSDYGWTFFDPSYINKECTTFVPNYDDSDVEPVSLPAQLPHVLMNTSSGIGVGITTNIPAFTAKSLLEILIQMTKGEKLKPLDFAKTLKPALVYGGHLVNSKDNKAGWLSMFNTSKSKVQYSAQLDVEEKKRQITIAEWPPGLNPNNLQKKLERMPEFNRLWNSNGVFEYTISVKPGTNAEAFQKFVTKVQTAVTVSESYTIVVTKREAKTVDGVTSYTNKLASMSVPQLILEWIKGRLALELRSLAYREAQIKAAIAKTELLIYACSIKDVIRSAWDQKDPIAYLVKKTKLNAAQATDMMQLKLIQIAKLEESVQKTKLAEQKANLAQIQKWIKQPKSKLLLDFEAMQKFV